MDNSFHKYAIFLDELRIEKGMTSAEFCDGICSDRTFRKYTSGERTISQKMINQFCQKLGFTAEEFFYSFDQIANKEYIKVVTLYFHVTNHEFEEAKILLKEFDKRPPKSQISRRLYNLIVIDYNRLTNKITKSQSYDRYANLIDYPKNTHSKYLDIVHIVCLQNLAILEHAIGKREALNRLTNIIKDPKTILISVEGRRMLVTVYSFISRMLGMEGKIEECILVAKQGIDYSLSINNYHLLDNLYYYISLGLYKLGKKEESKVYAYKCISSLISSNQLKRLKIIYNIMEKDFKEDPSFLDTIPIKDFIME